jgi:hypothetical protein
MSAVFMPAAFFCMSLKPMDSYIQKDSSHGTRTSAGDQKSLLTEPYEAPHVQPPLKRWLIRMRQIGLDTDASAPAAVLPFLQ